MTIPKSSLVIFLVICSSAFVGYSQVTGGGDSVPCIQKLMPCEAYLKGSPSPSTACCVPLKQMVSGDTQCLCAVFNNQAILKNLNVTQEDALHLVRNCGANDDISVCNKEATPASPSLPAASPTNGSETSAPPKKNAATVISQVGISAAILSFIVSILF
ncbi:Bifunctional inhibitor/lipid-transfer protein/seed storage 2S albumin superfamily protein [Perilla frutescens var. frutescens]|nr:Bifunctional inhibitor/lipid-transfer protein/seed storage 2S albumin superfamily protein [Perilla frutescens var. frutescens]